MNKSRMHIIPVTVLLLFCTMGINSQIKEDNFSKLYSSRQTSDPRVEWEQFGPGSSGYCEGTWYHPTDPNTIYISPDMGNTYRSLDGGNNWESVLDYDGTGIKKYLFNRIQNMAFSSIDENFGLAVNRFGLWITENKGESWYMDAHNDTQFWSENEDLDYLSAVTIDPSNDDIIYVGSGNFWDVKMNHRTYDNLYGGRPNIRSGIGKVNPGKIWRSKDRGKTWTLINKGIDPKAEIGKLFVDPVRPNIVYAASTHGLYKSLDQGENWQLKNRGLDTGAIRDMDLYYNPVTEEVILFVIDQVFWEPDSDGNIISSGGVFRSYDRAETWQNITSDDLRFDVKELNDQKLTDLQFGSFGFAGWFGISESEAREKFTIPDDLLPNFIRLVVDPTNPDRIYITHNPRHTPSISLDGVWATENGGKNWYNATRIGYGWQEDASFWQRRYHPEDVDLTEPNLEFGHRKYTRYHDLKYPRKYRAFGIRALSINSQGDLLMMFGQQLLISTDQARSWHQMDEIETPPGSNTWIGRGNSNVPGVYISRDERIADVPYFSTEEHGLWQVSRENEQIAVKSLGDEPFETPSNIAFDPEDVETIYTIPGKQSHKGEFMKSTDGGSTWKSLSKPLEIQTNLKLYSIIIDPKKPDNIYFCVPHKSFEVSDYWHNLGNIKTGVYKSSDGGYNWDIMNNGLPKPASIYDLVFDPKDSETLFAAALAHGNKKGGLFKTTNAAGQWQEITLPAAIRQVNDLHLDKEGRMYIATGIDDVNNKDVKGGGVWYSDDQGKSWTKIFELPFVMKTTTAPYNVDRIMVAIRAKSGFIKPIMKKNNITGWLNPGIYLSENRGKTWIKINTNLNTPHKINDIAFDAKDPDLFWALSRSSAFYQGKYIADLEKAYDKWFTLDDNFRIKNLAALNEHLDPKNIAVAWEEVSEADKFQVLIAKDPDFNNIAIRKEVDQTHVTIDDLDYEETYYLKVGALPPLPWISKGDSEYNDIRKAKWNSGGIIKIITGKRPQSELK